MPFLSIRSVAPALLVAPVAALLWNAGLADPQPAAGLVVHNGPVGLLAVTPVAEHNGDAVLQFAIADDGLVEAIPTGPRFMPSLAADPNTGALYIVHVTLACANNPGMTGGGGDVVLKVRLDEAPSVIGSQLRVRTALERHRVPAKVLQETRAATGDNSAPGMPPHPRACRPSSA